jgi:hypothetical protein
MRSIHPMFQAFQNNDEFIATKPYDFVVRSRCHLEAAGNKLQQLIPGPVAGSVIDLFKTIEVNEEHCQDFAGFLRMVKRAWEVILNPVPVWQLRQYIFIAATLQRFDMCLFLADIANSDGKRVARPKDLQMYPTRLQGAGQRYLYLAVMHALGECVNKARDESLNIEIPAKGRDCFANQFLAAQIEESGTALVAVEDEKIPYRAVRINDRVHNVKALASFLRGKPVGCLGEIKAIFSPSHLDVQSNG